MSTKRVIGYRTLTAVEALQLAQIGLGEQIQVRNVSKDKGRGFGWRQSNLGNPSCYVDAPECWLRINDNGDGKGWRIAVE